MRLAAIRRYPVKAMGGESLDVVEIGSRGLVGDRRYAVVDADGKFAAGKDTRRFARHDAVFDFTASTSARGVLVTGHGGHWWVGDPALDPTLSTAFGEPVQLREEGEVMHFDDSPVSVVGTASLQWCAERFGFVVQQERLRANLLVETDEPFVEETWSEVTVGHVAFETVKRITRCRVVDLDQDGVPERQPLLKSLAVRDVKLGVYLTPARPGFIRVGDQVSAESQAQ